MPGLKAAIVPVTPFQQNCSILWDDTTKCGAVVDPGGDIDRIREAIAKTGVQVEKILLTHGHIDHAGGAAALRDALAEGGRAIPIEGPRRARPLPAGRPRAAGPQVRHRRRATSCPTAGWPRATRSRSAATSSPSCTAPAIPPATSSSTASPTVSPWLATCCSAARSAAPTSPTATAPPSCARSARNCFRSATRSCSYAGPDRARPSRSSRVPLSRHSFI